MSGCHSAKKLQTAVNKQDTAIVNMQVNKNDSDFNKIPAAEVLKELNKNKIDFKTFS